MDISQDSQRHGLITLGEVQAFLRDILGDDILYEIVESKMLKQELTNKKNDSYRRIWDRYCKEETKEHKKVQDYIDYRFTSPGSISALSLNFFAQLLEKFKINPFWIDFLGKLAHLFYEAYASYHFDRNKKSDKPYLAAECFTNSFVYLTICKTLYYIVAEYSDKQGISNIKNYLISFLTDFTYKDLFDQLRIELDCKSFEKMYGKIGYEFSKKKIEKCKKNETSPEWQFLERILDYCSDELKEKMILKYLLNKAEESAKENLLLLDGDIAGIKKNLLNYCQSGDEEKPEDLLNNLLGTMKDIKGDPFFPNKNKPESTFVLILYNLLYKKNGLKNENADPLQLIESLYKETPIIAPFFVPWFKAIYCVGKRDFSKQKSNDENLLEAVNLYNEAFDYKYLAGDFIKEFLEMGFALENYISSDYVEIRKSFNNEGRIKNPVSDIAKKFYNFGYAINLFPESAEEAAGKTLNANDLFYRFYPLSLFFDEEGAKKLYAEEKNNAEIIEIDSSKIYENLNKLTPSQRNNLIFIKDIVSEDSKHNPKQRQLYPPLSICLHYCLQDERLLDLAERWLEDDTLKTTKLSYVGETPLCEALKIYKYVRLNIVTNKFIKETVFSSIKDLITTEKANSIFNETLDKEQFKDVRPKLKKGDLFLRKFETIICRLIDKTSFDSELQFGDKISTLTYAIDSFSSEFVKKIADKIEDKEFQEYRLYGNVSPLMYAIHRKHPVSMGFEEFIRITKDINVPKTLANQSLFFTREEAQHAYDYYNPRPKDIDEYYYHHDQKEKEITEEDYKWYYSNWGNPENLAIQNWQVRELDEIIEYFIGRTKDIDSLKIYTSTCDGDLLINTALIYAAQHNDADTCRKLLKRNARSFSEDFGVYIMKYGEKHYSLRNDFINTLCICNSWETLIMVFNEFSELIKESLSPDKDVNSFILFASIIKNRFIWAAKEKREYKDIAEYLIKLFIESGADPDAHSSIGSAREILAGTHLL